MNRILIVDDDAIGSKILLKNLEKVGFNCNWLEDGAKVFDYLENNEVDLVLLDVMMPNISGLDILKSIREVHKTFNLPVIMITAKDKSEDVVKAFELGASDYLTKPVDMSIAIARVETHINLKKLHASAVKSKEVAAMNTMIATYNHEINNPLAICMGLLKPNLEDMTQDRIDRLDKALMRIADIVKKIEAVTEDNMQTEDYASNKATQVLKLKKTD